VCLKAWRDVGVLPNPADKPTRKIPALLIRPPFPAPPSPAFPRFLCRHQPHQTSRQNLPFHPRLYPNELAQDVCLILRPPRQDARCCRKLFPEQWAIGGDDERRRKKLMCGNRACAARTRLTGVLLVLSMYFPISTRLWEGRWKGWDGVGEV